MKLTTPYENFLPPLSTEEFDALKQNLRDEGQQHDLIATEDGRLLDGHNRRKILGSKATVRVIAGSGEWSDARCLAYVVHTNWQRRSLSPTQKAALIKDCKPVAIDLKKEDKKKYTDAVLAKTFGFDRSTVTKWFEKKKAVISNVTGHIANNGTSSGGYERPDARVKVSPAAKLVIFERVQKGESQAQVAADYGIGQPQVSNIVKAIAKERKHEQDRLDQAEAAKRQQEGKAKLAHHGDFRVIAKDLVKDASIDLVFTDPPYHREHLDLYGSLGEFAARVLRPGGLQPGGTSKRPGATDQGSTAGGVEPCHRRHDRRKRHDNKSRCNKWYRG